MCAEHYTSGVYAVLLFIDFKFMNDLKNTEDARIVTVSSVMYTTQNLRFLHILATDLQFIIIDVSQMLRFSQQCMNIMFRSSTVS